MTRSERALREAARRPDDGAAVRAAAALRARARQAGLMDVAYTLADSPLGHLFLAATSRGLVRIAYDGDRWIEELLGDVSRRVSPRVLEAPEELDPIRRELDEYFAGRRTRFDVPVDLRAVRGFGRRVLRATSRIGYGEVSTYGQVAARAGSPSAYRAAGNALGANPVPIVVPCHRVLTVGGTLGGYGGGTERKEFLLRREGALPGGRSAERRYLRTSHRSRLARS